MRSRTVTAEVSLRLVAPRLIPMTASFSYSTDDPYAVSVAFRAGPGKAVTWVFARGLLSSGVEGRAGHGDVQVWLADPVPGDQHGRMLNIRLSSDHGTACIEVPARDVRGFLDRTWEVVPEGLEGSYADLDAGIAGLLG